MDEFKEILFVLLLVLEGTKYSDSGHWSASSREPLRSTIGISAVPTAIEYEYRFTEYRFAEYEYDEIRYEIAQKDKPLAQGLQIPGGSRRDRRERESLRGVLMRCRRA